MNKKLVFQDVERVVGAVGRALLAAIFLLAAGCSGNASEHKSADPKRREATLPVTVAEAVVKAIPVELPAVGRVEAYATVTIKAQVEGQVTAVHLREGQCVRAGDPLFTIDSRPFESQLKQVQANLARDKAQLDNARAVLQRTASVVDKGYVSRERYDQSVADVAALAATVQADEAAVETARLQLAYCAIRAPIAGCAGEVFVDKGNVVKANDAAQPLVVIKQIDPIHVGFSVPERHLPEVKRYLAANKPVVLVAPASRDGAPAKGQLTFVDNSVNAATGTILLKATFPNADQSLWPGQFVNVTLQLASQSDAVVVPAQALQTGQKGKYLFVLKADQTVELRPVRVDRTVGGLAIIADGVRPGDSVVTDGQLRLSPGAAVKIVAGLSDQNPDSKEEPRP
jgi:membrane fusion protein, multidrug efflux system